MKDLYIVHYCIMKHSKRGISVQKMRFTKQINASQLMWKMAKQYLICKIEHCNTEQSEMKYTVLKKKTLFWHKILEFREQQCKTM